jgi:hypothetical protein
MNSTSTEIYQLNWDFTLNAGKERNLVIDIDVGVYSVCVKDFIKLFF